MGATGSKYRGFEPKVAESLKDSDQAVLHASRHLFGLESPVV
jgi:hypothetical protein